MRKEGWRPTFFCTPEELALLSLTAVAATHLTEGLVLVTLPVMTLVVRSILRYGRQTAMHHNATCASSYLRLLAEGIIVGTAVELCAAPARRTRCLTSVQETQFAHALNASTIFRPLQQLHSAATTWVAAAPVHLRCSTIRNS